MRLHSPSRARVVVLGPPNLPHRWFRIASRFPCQQQGPQHENVIGGSRMIGRGSPHECKLNATGCDFHTAVGDPATAYEKAWKCHRIIGPFARLIPARVATIEKTMRSQNPSCGGKRCKTHVHLLRTPYVRGSYSRNARMEHSASPVVFIFCLSRWRSAGCRRRFPVGAKSTLWVAESIPISAP